MGAGPLLGIFFFLLLTAVVFFGKGVRLYTDWLWFDSVGYLNVLLTELKTRLWLGGILSGGFFLWLWPHYLVARAFRNKPRPFIEDDWLNFPRRHQLLQKLDKLCPVLLIALSVFLGAGYSGWWEKWLLFSNATPFGVADPVFLKDISFYVFRLEFLQKIFTVFPVLLFLTLVVVALAYALQRDIQLGEERIHITRPPQMHAAFLLLMFLVWKSVGYTFDIYDLLYSPDNVVSGATYTDIHARLPALRILQVMAFLTALSLGAPFFIRERRGWVIPGVFLALWIAVSLLGGTALPRFIQRFKVLPNEIVLETPYIERNIKFTRQAYGLGQVTEKPFSAVGDLTVGDLQKQQSTLTNVRLWDHRPLLATFSQLQEIRTYYKFASVDNDRYRINGDYRQVMLSVRELDHRSLPSRIWINEHLTYTHGYGLVMGPVNEVTGEGLPQLWVQDIPPKSTAGLEVTRPEIYYGEMSNEYVIVNTESKELDYPAGDQNVYTDYQGTGGITLNSLLRKVAYVFRFGTMKILLSRDITPESRILYDRNVTDRIRKIAPFFLYDRDPYAVLSEGRVFWIIDGYTITNRYPYSQSIRGALNYIRNSIKVVVDAYSGTVDFYAMDVDDPIVKAYQRVFPGLLKPLAQMPEGLRSHLRYPQDMFEVQSAIYTRYHMTDAQVFYNQEDLWTTPNEVLEGNEVAMEPYYTIMRLPGEEKEEYILMLPFTPRQKSNLIAWMAARSDGPHYGELLVFRFPKERLIYGPMQIEARIDQDSQISQQFTLWGQRGVQVLRGNLLVIPVKNSLLYIEPIYLQAERGKIPELRRVVVSFEDRISMKETLDEALRDIFTGWVAPVKTGGSDAGYETLAPSRPSAWGQEAWDVFQRGQDHLKKGDWEGFGRALKELEDILHRMKEKRGP